MACSACLLWRRTHLHSFGMGCSLDTEREKEREKSYPVFRILIASRWDRKKKKKKKKKLVDFRSKVWVCFGKGCCYNFDRVWEEAFNSRVLREASVYTESPTSTGTPKYPNR